MSASWPPEHGSPCLVWFLLENSSAEVFINQSMNKSAIASTKASFAHHRIDSSHSPLLVSDSGVSLNSSEVGLSILHRRYISAHGLACCMLGRSPYRQLVSSLQPLFVQSLNNVSNTEWLNRWFDLQANVSSMFTISLALVSINPQSLLLAQSSPILLLTTLASFKSHLLPAMILIGGILHPASRFPRTLLPFSRSSRLFSSIRLSVSISIMSRNHDNPSSECVLVMSYTNRKASDCRLDAAHKLRYSSWPAVSVSERW